MLAFTLELEHSLLFPSMSKTKDHVLCMFVMNQNSFAHKQALQTLKTEACSLRGNVERLRQTLEDKDAVVGCLRADAERLQKSLIAKETELQLANSSHNTEVSSIKSVDIKPK